MTTASTTHSTQSFPASVEVSLSVGRTWNSFEQLRVEGGRGLLAGVGEGQVGFVRLREAEFALLRRHDFDRLYALAQDARRLARGIPLFRTAAELVLQARGGKVEELAIRQFRELTMTFPELMTSPTPAFAEIVLDATDDTQEGIDPGSFRPPRAATNPEPSAG